MSRMIYVKSDSTPAPGAPLEAPPISKSEFDHFKMKASSFSEDGRPTSEVAPNSNNNNPPNIINNDDKVEME
jgi:hypothetical protein